MRRWTIFVEDSRCGWSDLKSAWLRYVALCRSLILYRYYYQYSPNRLSTCLLTIHALLHVADSIEAVGPAWAYWAFPMERFCGRLQRCIKSRRFPFANIDTFVVADARLKQLGLRWRITDMLKLKPIRQPSALQRYEVRIHGCECKPRPSESRAPYY